MTDTTCRDCGTDTTPCTDKRGCRHAGRWELYMVKAEIWSAARMGYGDGHLCIGCLEHRLGRTLTRDDFDHELQAGEPSPWDTPRLADRKRRTP